MRRPFLVGDRVYLRALEPEDLAGPYVEWMNDYEVTRFLETGMFPVTTAALQRYLEATAAPTSVLLAIVEKSSGRHVGNIKLGPVHALHRRADLGIMLGDKRSWGRGYGREAVDLLLAYAFDRLNLNKVTLGLYADHEAALRLYEGAGFKIEGTQRQQLFRDGAYRDRHVMGILREEYVSRRGPRP
jgi:RimJ/RimL family protein N-acetyltransferase